MKSMKIYTHEKKTYTVHVHKTASSHTEKLTTTLTVNGIEVEMEVDTGAKLSTMPNAVYKQKLSHIRLQPSTVRLHQYDGTTLPTKGEIVVNISTDQ